MSDSPLIRQAVSDEAAHLSALALRSKAYWGYPEDFLEACRAELTVEPHRLRDDRYRCFVAVENDAISGFYAVEPVSETVFELEALFVEPDRIGRGIGRLLIRHALDTLAKRNATRLLIQGDPHATEFYLAAGARRIGWRPSDSIPGRSLPLFEIDIAAAKTRHGGIS